MDATQNTSQESQANDMEVQKKMVDEHLRLQRQMRHIQADRRQVSNSGIHPQLRRQDQLLRILKREYLNHKTDLKIARSGAHKKRDKTMKSDLRKALLVMQEAEFQCEDGYTIMSQLDELIKRNNKQMLQLKKMVNTNMGQINERRARSENQLVSTENRLETAVLRFNTVQCENMKIREEIEHMLKDRLQFNQVWTKMLTVLNKGKKFLADLFESSTLAYDQRDEWCTKLRSVQEKGKIDQMLQLQEMRDLQKAFDHEMKLFNFLAKKGVVRINKKEELREELVKKKEDENAMKALRAHNAILDEVTNYTHENEEKTMDSFVRMEQEINSVYKMLTDCCAENEMLSRDLKKIRQELEDRRDWNEEKETLREGNLEKMRQELEGREIVKEKLQSEMEEKVQLLNRTMEKVDDIFKMLGCSTEPFQNLLGDKRPSLWQLNLTLCLITARIKEYLEIVYYYERHVQKNTDMSTSRLKKYTVHADTKRRFTALPINLMVPSDPCPSCVEVRWLSRVSDTPEVPMDRKMVIKAIAELSADPTFVRSDRVHPLTECKVPRSRVILANRYMDAKGIFADAGVPDFFAILRARTASCWERLRGSANDILTAINDDFGNCFTKHWLALHRSENGKL